MGHETKLRPVALILEILSIGSVLSFTLLLPKSALSLLSIVALVPAIYAVQFDSRPSAFITDAILLVSIVGPHLLGVRAVDLSDVVRIILMLSFHELSLIHSDLERLMATQSHVRPELTDVSGLDDVLRVFTRRALLVSTVLVSAGIISAGYYYLALSTMSSLSNIIGVAFGLAVLVVFLLLFSGQPLASRAKGR